jgi:tape measure domain-containing protein
MNVIELKAVIDLEDAGLQAGVRRTEGGLKEIEQQSNATGDAVDRLGTRLGKALSKVDGAKIKDFGQTLSMGVTLPLMAVGGGALKAAADLDSLKRGLISVAGSSGAAEQQLARLREVAKLPGLGFNEAVQGSIRLQAAGFSANQAEKSLSAFGNAIASVGGGKAELDGVTLALTQIASKGKISAEEINQLSERVPQVRKAMQTAFGTADTEVLQKSGLGAEEFVSKLTAELAKIPPVTGGIKNDFENLSDTIQQSAAKVGTSLVPAASAITNVLAPAVTGLADGYSRLSAPVQAGLLAVAATAAVAGPATMALGGLFEGAKKVREGWQSLTEMRAAVAGAFTAKTAATVADTAATVVDTGASAASASAKTVEMEATAASRGVTQSAEQARQAHTRALWDEYRALEANTKAEFENAMAVKASADSVAAGQSAGAAATGMRTGRLAATNAGSFRVAGVGAGAVAAGVITAGMVGLGIGSEINDKASFDGGPSIGAADRQAESTNADTEAMLAKSPALRRIQELKAERKRLTEALSGREITGNAAVRLKGLDDEIAAVRRTGSDKPKEADKAASEADKKKFAAAADAQYDSLVESAKASIRVGDDQTKAQREAKALLPLLAAHQADLAAKAKELEPLIKTDADAAVKYWRYVKEQTQTQDQAEELKQRAAKEAADTQKKAEAKAKTAQREGFALRNMALDNSVLAARAQSAARGEGEDGDPNRKALRENEMMRPVLTAKQGDLTAQARALLASGKADAETVKEYEQLRADYLNLEIQKGILAAGAARAEKNLQKKAGEEAQKGFAAQLQIQRDQAIARAAEAAPGNEARGLATELAPVLEAAQDALIADLAHYKEGSEDYWKAVGEIEKSKREIAQLDQRAAKEAASEQQKAVTATHKAAQERRGLMSAEAQLAELQLKNNPFLSGRQRTRAMVPLLLQQYREAMRPIQGETRVESVQRQIGGEQLRGQLLESLKGMGMGRRGMMVAMGQLNGIAGQAQADPYLARAATADARQVANTAAAGRPTVFQILLDPNASPQQQFAQFQEMTRRASREAGFIGPAGR